MPQPWEFQPTVNAGKLPIVGVQALVAGAQQFFSDMGKVEQWMGRVGTASTRMASVSSSAFRVVGSAMSSSAAVMFAATAAIEGVGAAAIGMASAFQQKMTIAQAALGETEGAMRGLSDAAIEMSRVAPISVSQLADATVDLAKAGINIEKMSEGALKAASNLMIASGGELTIRDAALLIAGGMNAFNIAGRDSAEVADALTAAANSSAITFRDLRLSFQQTAAVASMLGYTIGETTTALGLLGRAGLRGSDAGTSLKQMFISLLSPTPKATQEIAKYGITLFDASGKALAMRAIVSELQKAFGDAAVASGKITEAQRAQSLAIIFGSDAWRAAILLARQGVEAYDDMAAAARNLTAEQMAAKMLGAVNTQFMILRNNVEAAAIIIGREALPALGALLEGFNKVAQSIKPQVFELFGKAIIKSLVGGDITGLMEEAKKQLGLVAPVFNAWLRLLLEVRSAIVDKVVPGFYTLFSAMGQGKDIGDILVGAFDSIGRAVRDVSTAVTTGMTALANVLKSLRSSATGLLIVESVFKGLGALPLIALAAVVAKIATTFLGLGGSTFAVALAIGALTTILPKNQAEWVKLGTTLSNYVYPALIAVGTAMGYIATTQLISLGAAVAQVAGRFILFGRLVFSAIIAPLANVAISVGEAVISFAMLLPHLIAVTARALAAAAAFTALAAARTAAFAVSTLADALMLTGMVLRGTISGALALAVAFKGVGSAIAAFKATTLITTLGALAAKAVVAGGALLTSLGGAIIGIGASIAPLLLGLVAIGAAVGVLYLTWTNDWFGIQGFTAKVINFVIDQLKALFNWLKTVPAVGDAFKWIESAANTAKTEFPKIVEAGKGMVDGLIWQFQHGFPIVQDLMKGMLTPPEVEMPSALKEPDWKGKWDQYNLGARQAKRGVDDWASALDDANAAAERTASTGASAMKAAQRNVRDLREEVQDLEAALRDAHNEMEKWADPKLIGMGAADDAIFALEQQSKQAQIEVLKTGDAAKKATKDVGDTFDILAAQQREISEGVPVALQLYQWAQKKAQDAARRAQEPSKREDTPQQIAADELERLLKIARLQRELTFDPQLRQARKLYESLKGTDQEVTLQQALDNLRAADTVAKDLEAKLAPAKDRLTAAEAELEALQDQQAAASGFKVTRNETLEIEGQILDRYQRMTIELNAQRDAIRSITGWTVTTPIGTTMSTEQWSEAQVEAQKLAAEQGVTLSDAMNAVLKSYRDLGRPSRLYEESALDQARATERTQNAVSAIQHDYEIMGGGPLKRVEDATKEICLAVVSTSDNLASVTSATAVGGTLTRNFDNLTVLVGGQNTLWGKIIEKVDELSVKLGPQTALGKMILALMALESKLSKVPTDSGPVPYGGPGEPPRYQHGTMFAPGGLAMVGEAGPELVRLPRGSQVYPTRATNYSSQATTYNDQWNISGVSNPIDVWGVVQRRLRMQRITEGR